MTRNTQMKTIRGTQTRTIRGTQTKITVQMRGMTVPQVILLMMNGKSVWQMI